MDRKLNKRIADYVSDFKKNIRNQALMIDFAEKEKIEQLIQYVYEYDRLVLSKEDVSKRKRIKNSIPSMNRCHAKRANGEQCTRKQKEGCMFCGTHEKGTPHGVVETNGTIPIHIHDSSEYSMVEYGTGTIQQTNSVVVSEVFAEEIGGIVYYLDKYSHVFNTEDVLKNLENPRVVATYTYQDGVYHIPEYGI